MIDMKNDFASSHFVEDPDVVHLPFDQKITNSHFLAAKIHNFESISLNEIEHISLMDRVDTKFTFPVSLLPQIIKKLEYFYNILEIKENRIFTYQNVYWDTAHFNFYHAHHNGKLNRYKVRFRRYKETGAAFLEVKFKTNKKRTIKERISVQGLYKSMLPVEDIFIKQRLPKEYQDLQPSLLGVYRRITFTSKTSKERVTIDFDVRFQHPSSGKKVYLKNLVIAEVKRSKTLTSSRFLDVMREYRLHATSFSKYCIGCCITAGERIKTNRFKMKIRGLNLIELRNKKNGNAIS
ncbi:MAG: polyphosphate polymerase domain-containing protein [Deferribacteres bacterium]|nr:polyphosphate polymerase domain-containing protein [Deferribacteres bacterium]